MIHFLCVAKREGLARSFALLCISDTFANVLGKTVTLPLPSSTPDRRVIE